MTLWDTSASEDYDSLRPCIYPDTDIFIVCYSVVDPNSFDNIEKRWVPEIRKSVSEAKFIVVGLKNDLVKKVEVTPVATEDGERLAKAVGAQGFHECSALNTSGHKVLESVLDAVLKPMFSGKKKK
eukprot:CAMPEP_0204840238 /NCGR_PEP_ID=MMETSP1346-20131115/36968_1 /ASSEMBLY_ACC=CAM_ASM_000771 /TAXON_ID=215587 /ORGANISM="Aplanochytrium stocchinoi, Strain GSBS06" /LENGTH=125 /DNA_ID=CAMNT_0051977505 /DNA_START=264 /DNA_END=641 /DNA_ORIENTATION=+